MTKRCCPVTGELLPVTDPGRIVSQAACNRLRTATSNLVDIMGVLDQLIAGAGGRHEGSGPAPQSKPPLNVGLWVVVDEARDIIDIWANNLITEARPGVYYRPGDWQMAQAIFQQHADLCGHWTFGEILPGVLCVERVTEAVRKLEKIAFPSEDAALSELERAEARERLEDMELTIGPACEAVRLISGVQLPAATVRSWKARGHVDSSGRPPRYRVGDLLGLQHRDVLR